MTYFFTYVFFYFVCFSLLTLRLKNKERKYVISFDRDNDHSEQIAASFFFSIFWPIVFSYLLLRLIDKSLKIAFAYFIDR